VEIVKICLIIPPSGFLLDERVFPSLGVLKVASVLKAQHDVSVCDLSGVKDIEAVEFPQADVYGLTATTPQMPFAGCIEHLLRERFPKKRVILGGPHVTMVNAAAKRGSQRAVMMRDELSDRFDALVAGDGEHAIFDALKHDTLIDADEPKSVLFLSHGDLLVEPARHLLDIDSYHYEIDGHRATSLVAQLGCPFGCGFCGGRSSPSFRRMRTRPTEAVVSELIWLYQTYGYTGFMFYDDELNVNKAFPELLRAIIAAQKRLDTRWALRGFVKSELLTDEQAALMAEAGFKTLLVGFESGSERILWNIQKRATVEDNTRCIETIHRHGMWVKALMSFGHPGESHATMQETQEWLLNVKPEAFDATVITVYPGTPYFDEAREEQAGIWTYRAPKTNDAIHARPFSQFSDTLYYKGVPGEYESFVHTDALSESALAAARDQLEDTVRKELGVPYPSETIYEHSMGQHAS
jgi:anaerobic magnesium-protoporphyrin IX monomethyl ester cyclase